MRTILLIAAAAAVLLTGCANEETPTGTASKLPPPFEEPPVDPDPVVPDTEPPVVSVGPLEPDQTSFRFEVAVDAADTGSGVADYELWVAPEHGDTTLVGTFATSPVAFHADTSGVHSFWAVATDSAGNRSVPPEAPDATTTVPDRIVIIDVMEEHYDITHAVLRYNLSTWGWGHGMGRNAFPPINFPALIAPGGIGFPDPDRTFDTIGVSYGPGARAYPIGDIVAREVVNDTLSGVHFAATY